MIVNTGDTVTLIWEPSDPGTNEPSDPLAVTATLRSPTGAVTSPPVTHQATGQWSTTPEFSAAGDWLLTWTSTGPDQVDEVGIYAVPAGLTATWAPTLRDVAVHISSRTRQVNSDNMPAGTFNSLTEPTGDAVQLLINAAVSTVAGFVGRPLMPTAYPLCSTAAALWSAYWVELSSPERDADVSVYAQLRADAEAMTKQATAVNLGAGGGTEGTPDPDGLPDVSPLFAFPGPPVWADRLYW